MSAPPITAKPHVFYVRPAPGWLDVVHAEVAAVIAAPLQKYKFEPKVTALQSTIKVHRCDWRQGLELLLRLTTAHDVEWLVLESKCTKWSDVDAVLARVPWREILPNQSVTVHVSADVDHAFTTASAKLRENLCRIAGVTHVSEGAAFRFKIELRGELLRVLVSLAGEPLYKRGYKTKLSAMAPLAEHHAAASMRYVLAGAPDAQPVGSVCVPFAGSGTLGFEAQVVLAGAGPGSFARVFACEKFPCVSAATMGFLRRKLTERLSTADLPPVIFNEWNAEALAVLQENIAAFAAPGNSAMIAGDFFAAEIPLPPTGSLLTLLNPPYGDRLGDNSDVPALYARLGDYWKNFSRRHPGRVLGGCLCPDSRTWRRFLDHLDAPAAETHHFTHGGKEMRLVRWHA